MNGDGADGVGSRPISMDTAAVSAVSAYYRRSSLVLSAVADDLAAHDFGTWARESIAGDENTVAFGPSAAAYAEMSATLSRRLRVQATAAAALADTLRNSALTMADGDRRVAGEISRALPPSEVDVR